MLSAIVPSEWTLEPNSNLYSAHSSSRGSTVHLHSDDLTDRSSCSLFVLLENSGYQKVILRTPFIHASSHFHCFTFTCIALEALYFTLHFNGLFPILHYRTVITHHPTVRYGLAFIAFPWSRVFLSSGIVLSQAAYGDPSLGLTPLINSARRSAEPHVFDWLAVGAASLEESSDWLSCVLH